MDVIQGLHRAVKLFPNHIAIMEGDWTLTWREFEERNRKLAAGLTEAGLEKGQRVAVLMLNRFQYLEVFYAVMRLGGVVVPLNTRYSVQEIIFVIQDSEPSLFITDTESLKKAEKVRETLPNSTIRHWFAVDEENPVPHFLSYNALLADSSKEPEDYDIKLDSSELAGLFYTGGTTGRAKGVMLTQGNLASNSLHAAITQAIQPGDIWFHVAPMFHLADLGRGFAYTLAGGGHTFLASFDPVKVLQIIEQHRVSATMLVPTMLNTLLQLPNSGKYDLSSLKSITYGAAPMPLELLTKILARFSCDFRQGYGMTEASPQICSLSAQDHRKAFAAPAGSAVARRLSSCGQPVIGVEVRVVDSNDREVVPGEVGEIIVQGPNIMKGYWRLPFETSQALKDGWLRTGDMATIDDEFYIYIVDRQKDMIISGGENVYSLEVENILYAYPGVMEAAVVGLPDPYWGERVHAVVVLKSGYVVSGEELISFCRSQIAHYKAPKTVDFWTELPKSGAGKILKRILKESYLSSGTLQMEI